MLSATVTFVKVSVALMLLGTLRRIECTTVIESFSTSSIPTIKANGTADLKPKRHGCTVDTRLDLNFDTAAEKDQCCSEIVKSFRYQWIEILYHISDFLRILKKFQCPQFNSECNKYTYDFTPFTSLTYDRFCGSRNFYLQCGRQIKETTRRYQNDRVDKKNEIYYLGQNDTTNDYSLIDSEIRSLRNMSLDINDLLQPCIQASLVDLEQKTLGGYYEMKEMQTPFCDLIWCGFPGYAFDKYEISEWTCMPSR